MMIDIRYHLGSLAAVFLALGIGILIGAVAFEERLVVGQEDIIAALEARFSELQKDKSQLEGQVETLSQELSEYRDLVERLLPRLVHNRLDGTALAVLVSAGDGQETGVDLKGLIEEAGGHYAGKTTIREASREGGRLGYFDTAVSAGTGVIVVFQKATSEEWAAALPLMRDLADSGLRVVAAELGTETSFAAVIQRDGFPLVENISNPVGRFYLVEAVSDLPEK